MSARLVWVDEEPMPTVWKLCARCRVTDEDVATGRVVVSPRGVAHHGRGDVTACKPRRDATGAGWWWPL